MARQVIEKVVSDLSGATIPEGEAWVMELLPPDGRRNKVKLDLTEEEALEFAAKGTEVKRRGRRPGTKNKTEERLALSSLARGSRLPGDSFA